MSKFVLTAQLQLQAPNNVKQVVQQIQSQLNGVSVNIQVQNAGQAQKQIQQVAQATNQATTAAERMGKAFALSIRRFAAFSIATRAVGLFTSTLSDAVQTSIDFERQLIKVSQVTGKSLTQLRGLTKQITDLSTGFGVASSDLLNVSTILAQAGLSAEDTAVALKTLAKSALAPNFDSITETAEGAIAVLAQFKEGVGSLEKQLGSINAVAGAFAVEAGDLIDVIRRTGGVFKASGGDLNELLALFTSVRATTRESAESIGTGLRTIFTRIQRPKTIEFLKQFGVELVDLNGKFVGPYEAIKKLSEALAGLGEGDTTFIRIAEELGGFRQIGKVLPLLQQFSTAQSALNVAMKAGDSLTQDAASSQAALAIRIMKVKEEFLALVRSITETSTFQVMANTALSLASALIKIGDSIKPLLPMLAALSAFKLVKGMGGFFGGMMSGAASGRTYNKGGKVLGFARGGLVPGTGNSDTVPAMLAPGEFVIRKSSVNKMGAGTLAAMNNNRYAAGGIVNNNRSLYGTKANWRDVLSANPSLTPNQAQRVAKGTLTLDKAMFGPKRKKGEEGAEGQIKNITLSQPFGVSFLKGFGSNVDMSSTINDIFKYGNATGVKVLKEAITKSTGKSIAESVPAGTKITATRATPTFLDPSGYKIFEDDITNILPMAFDKAAKKFNGELDISGPPRQINQLLSKSAINSIEGQFFEAFVRSVTGNVIKDDGKTDSIFDFTSINQSQAEKLFGTKQFVLPNEFKNEANKRNIASSISKALSLGPGSTRIQKFAKGGMAEAPLVDDILKNASGSLLPRPSSAITALIKAGGGAIDIDRTLKRTIGDKAYGNAKTDAQRQAVLGKYFSGQNRLNDIRSAPLTTFGQELQAAIKSGQLKAGRLSIISKSQRTPGVAEYLSQLFGIPIGNMMFTQGGSKQPAMDALRNKGPRSLRKKFALGGVARDPKNTLQSFFEGNSLYSSDRKETANKIRDMRSLRSAAPQLLYSSISRNAFDSMANQTGLNKNPKIPEGTKLFDREKYYDQEAKKIIGRTFKLSGFLSTSKEINKAKTFLDNADRSKDNWAAMMTIMTKKNAMGVDVEKQLSGRKVGGSKQALNPRTGKMETFYQKPPESESEFTLQPGSRFKVNSSKLVDMMGRKNLWMDVQQFAKGGGVGTDTVPALLTPGEFVVNRSSAQRIGYGALNRMNKVGKYAKGGVVNGQHVQRFFVGGQADKDAVRAQGTVLTNIGQAEAEFNNIMGSTAKSLRDIILSKFEGIKEIKGGDTYKAKDKDGFIVNKSMENTRGIAVGQRSMGFQIKGKNVAATTETVAHETGHVIDTALGGGSKKASNTQGTFQFDLVEKVKPQMEAAFKAAGMDAQNIEKYLASNEELFAEFFAKASPEVRAIITATTDSKIGMQKLADHLEKAGHTYAGLESSDITGIKPVPTPTPVTPPKKPTGPSSPPSGGPPSKPPSGSGTPTKTSPSTVVASGSSGGGGLFSDVGANIAIVSAALSTMLPPLDENAGALTKVGHSLLTLVTTVGGVIYALGQFNIQIKAANIASFAKSLTTMGKGGLGEMIGGFTREGGKTSRAAGESITSSFGIGKQRSAVAQARSERASQLLELRGQRNSLRGQTGFKAFSERADVTQKIKGLAQAPSKLPGLPNSLTGKIGNFLGQKAAGGGFGGRLAGMAGNAITKVGGLGSGAVGGAVGGALGTATAMAGPALAVVGAVAAINSVIGSFRDLDDKLKSSIEAGKVEEASRLAVAQKASEFPLIGNIVSSIFGESGDAFLLGVGELFGGPSLDSVKQLAAAQAGAAKTTKSLEEAQKVASDAMNDFKNGSISAADALARIRAKTGEASNQQKRASSFVATNLEQRGGISRDIFTLGGLLGETSTARNKRLGAQNVEQINQSSKFMADAFNIESEARQATIRSGVARGKNSEEIRTTAMGNLRSQREEALKTAKAAAKSGDTATYDAAIAQAEQLRQSMEQVDKEIANIEKEVKRQKELYDAMNLGLRSATATATALSASMDKFSAGLEVGGSTFVSDVEFLQSAMSSAAQAMDSGEIQSAVKGVSDNLREFGSSEQYIKKFEGNVAAFTQAQSNYTQAFANIKKSMKDADFKNLSADDLKKKFADELTKDMGDGEAKKSLKAVINSLELGDEDVNKILAGDLSVFGDKLSESQKKMLEDVQKIAAERAKAEQVLIDFTKKRIDSERNLVQAQQEALDLVMEGREIQGKYGGQAVTGRERKDNLLAKSNAESSRLGLTNMKNGDVGDLRRRNSEIMAGFSNIEARRSQQGGMKGRSGVEADEAQKDLQKAYKTQIDTIRGLIKLEEEQLKITQEKNKLEKDSMESLVKGDVEDFFKKQSAVGATAAIASGDTRLQNLYGADALGAAYQDIQRQQEAGVQSLYGQQLAGSGGLTEAAAGAALSSRGVTDMRAAQVMAGTTAEEEASKARLRELGGMLGETGNMGTQMAEMQVETATINVNSADLKFKEVMAKGNKAAAEAQAIEDQKAMARGGMVYASRGIFVPRGTDTIPAMLTPGEFVVNRGAVQRGNNLQILQAMNSGLGGVSSSGGTALMASGGMVRYRGQGSNGPEQQSQGMSNFATALENFNRELSKNVESLRDSKITIKLDSTNVNINLNDGGLLKAVTSQVKQEIFNLVKTRLVAGDGGRLKENSGVV